LGFTVVLMEQNSIPGLTNRLLSHIADKIIIHFNEASRHFPPGRTVRLGNPIRPHLLTVLTTAHTTVPSSGSSAAPGLLILGGSQGAHNLNQLVTDAAPALVRHVPGLRLIHQTGIKDRDWVAKAYQSAGITARVEAFIEDMAQVYSEVDLVISRSGAMTLAELCVAGLPALLIPYPFAADDHQAVNARELELAGGAVVFKQNEVTVQKLIEEAGALLVDSQRRMQMSEAMRKNGFPQAAADIVHLLSGWLQS
jgi:UDP-N-acetylglucosamine--N-acetylmuramyl-(pentapeptide) pyrophosphoryl-undecaprenol N-acetylglucosamine transferase